MAFRRNRRSATSASAAWMIVFLFIWPNVLAAENWPGWRGQRGDGTSNETGVATEWNGEAGSEKNVRWKAAIPGKGHASPIVWGKRVFVVTCDDDRQERLLICYDVDSGKELWKKLVLRSPLEKKHTLNSFASSTPATDGQRIYVTFLKADGEHVTGDGRASPGAMVVAAYDLTGNEVWRVEPGQFSSMHGYCSSPVLFDDMLIINGDHDGDGYLVALDRSSGQTRWKIPRPNNTRSYCTPIIRDIGGRTQMVLSGSKCVTSYDPHDGSLHWIIDGPTEQFVASLVYNGRLLFLTAGFPEYHLLAIDPSGHGNVTGTHIRWRTREGAGYVPSPIAAGPYFLVTSDSGIASCFVAETGQRLWKVRLGSHYSGSPVLVDGLVYLTSDDGVTKIVRPGPKFDLVAENRLGENCYSSPAVSNGRIYIRAEQSLYCIEGRGAIK